MQVRDFDRTKGQAFQGDIAIIPMPPHIAIATTDEIKPRDGRLIIQEGEVTGHHHAIAVPRVRRFRADTRQIGDPATATRDTRLIRALGGKRAAPSVRLYRDASAVAALRSAGIVTRTDLAIGCLIVEAESVVITHDEHDGIRLPPGAYYIGRQVESAGAEERIVAD